VPVGHGVLNERRDIWVSAEMQGDSMVPIGGFLPSLAVLNMCYSKSALWLLRRVTSRANPRSVRGEDRRVILHRIVSLAHYIQVDEQAHI
jgi:hypothetical protein